MEYSRKNRAIFIDKEALYTLSLAQNRLLYPVTKLMNQKEAEEVDKTKLYKDISFPFSFILAPSGKRNQKILLDAKTKETLDLICNSKKCGEIIVEEVFKIDPIKRLENIFNTTDISHPGFMQESKRIGEYAICGEFFVEDNDIVSLISKVNKFKNSLESKNITALMLAARPLHRATERVIRTAIDKSDGVVIFLLKPYKKDLISYNIRQHCMKYFADNYLPKNRVLVVPLNITYIFAGNNELLLESIIAQNLHCNRIMIGDNHAGIGLYYEQNSIKTIFDSLVGFKIKIDIISKFVYCNECKTLVSTKSCPHGGHHHISYHSDSILELIKLGLIPPAVLIRKEISAILLSELFPNRFKDINKLYQNILPSNGILEEKQEKDLYVDLIELYQTTSLN
jgi:sulfate adenylyltransferase